jgi:hypothetical protein
VRPLALLLVLTGCGGCPPSVPSELRVEGPVPYVRCLAFDPPDEPSFRVGSHEIAIEERVIRVEGFREVELAVFSGPAGGELDRSALEQASGADVAIVLGGFGRTRASTSAFFEALSARSMLTLLVAGGDDDADVYRAALDELEGERAIIDASAFDRVDFGFGSVVFVAGAPNGRYARSESSCGYGEHDLDALAERLGRAESPRWIASWAAPAGAAGSSEGADAGDPTLRAFMTRIAARGGLFAWPELAAGEPVGAPDRLEWVVPSVSSTFLERADGSRVPPSVARATLSAGGLSVAANEP